MSQISYRPDLDGLRGIAIVMAVIYHTGLGIFPSGFVGIEIFFVLSGFLITSQISRDILDSSFSIKAFYLRRFRRLLPAYFFITIAIFIAASFILLPVDYMYHVKLMGLGFLSVGNFYLANTTGGYFAKEIDEIPFVHTWSLSVEEQFYLLWPIILLFVLRKFSYKTSIMLFSALLVVALLYSEWTVNHNPIAAYFLLPSRFYELLLGSILGLVAGYLPALKKWQANTLSLLGLLVIAINTFSHTASQHFPGFNALYVCMATVFIIYAGGFKNAVSDFISTRPFTSLGKISYSLYLWHWPILVFIRYTTGGITTQQAVMAIAASLVLSYLTWKLIENPFRIKWKFPFRKTFIGMYLVPAMIFIVINIVVDKYHGMPERFNTDPLKVQAMEKRPSSYNESCVGGKDEKCAQVIIMGDSHAEHFSPFVHVLTSQNPALKLKTQSIGFCFPVVNMYRAMVNENTGKKNVLSEDSECVKKTDEFYKNLTEKQYKYVVLAGYWSIADLAQEKVFYFDKNNPEWSYATTQKVFRRALFESVNLLVQKGITPVIIKDNPAISESLLRCSRNKILAPDNYGGVCEISRAEVTRQQAFADSLFSEIAKSIPQVKFISPNDVICTESNCATIYNDMPLYHDKQHLTDVGSRMLGEAYLKKNGNPFFRVQ